MRVDTVTPQVVTTVKIGSRTAVVEGVRVKVPVITVRGPRAAVARAIEAMAAAEVRDGLRRFAAAHGPKSPSYSEYDMKATVLANTSPVLVIEFFEYTLLGNSGVGRFRAVTVDTRTGKRWSSAAIASAVQGSARPGVDLVTVLRRRLDPTGNSADHVDLSDVTLVPTRAGLTVLVDKCTIWCMEGAFTVTLPWRDLLAPGSRLPFAPWV